MENTLQELKKLILDKWNAYKRRPKRIPAGIASLLEQSHYKKAIALSCTRGQLTINRTDEVQQRRRMFGKNLLFCANPQAETGWIIEQYRGKDRIEDDFKLLKTPELIRWRPCRHWTDTKIRAFGFCCVMALVLLRVMELKAAKAGIRMSPLLIKEELTDLKEITLVYDTNTADIQITTRSSVQQRLWDLFNKGGMSVLTESLCGKSREMVYFKPNPVAVADGDVFLRADLGKIIPVDFFDFILYTSLAKNVSLSV